jgi:hypothetical protein
VRGDKNNRKRCEPWIIATPSNCGKLLKFFVTKQSVERHAVAELIAPGYGKECKEMNPFFPKLRGGNGQSAAKS